MNPIVIVGILAISTFAAAMMISFANEQARYAQTVERVSDAQSQRLHEEMDAVLTQDGLVLENAGSVKIQVKEIRILDNNGYVVYTQKADYEIPVSQEGRIRLDPAALTAIAEEKGRV